MGGLSRHDLAPVMPAPWWCCPGRCMAVGVLSSTASSWRLNGAVCELGASILGGNLQIHGRPQLLEQTRWLVSTWSTCTLQSSPQVEPSMRSCRYGSISPWWPVLCSHLGSSGTSGGTNLRCTIASLAWRPLCGASACWPWPKGSQGTAEPVVTTSLSGWPFHAYTTPCRVWASSVNSKGNMFGLLRTPYVCTQRLQYCALLRPKIADTWAADKLPLWSNLEPWLGYNGSRKISTQNSCCSQVGPQNSEPYSKIYARKPACHHLGSPQRPLQQGGPPSCSWVAVRWLGSEASAGGVLLIVLTPICRRPLQRWSLLARHPVQLPKWSSCLLAQSLSGSPRVIRGISILIDCPSSRHGRAVSNQTAFDLRENGDHTWSLSGAESKRSPYQRPTGCAPGSVSGESADKLLNPMAEAPLYDKLWTW